MLTEGQYWKKGGKTNWIKSKKGEFRFEFKRNNQNQIILNWNALDRKKKYEYKGT